MKLQLHVEKSIKFAKVKFSDLDQQADRKSKKIKTNLHSAQPSPKTRTRSQNDGASRAAKSKDTHSLRAEGKGRREAENN